jgi:hypothetical protein
VRISSGSSLDVAADAFLFDCSGKNGCEFVDQKQLDSKGAILVADEPHEGWWRIVVRTRDQTSSPVSYSAEEASLVVNTAASPAGATTHASNTSWSLPLPTKQADARYAAFRIPAIARELDREKDLLIGITPLDDTAF